MPARKGKKGQRAPNRHVEQATEQLATMERELNALRLDLRGRPAPAARFSTDRHDGGSDPRAP